MTEWLTTKEVARMLGVRPDTVRRWRSEGHGPQATRFTDTARPRVWYAKSDVIRWMDEGKETQ